VSIVNPAQIRDFARTKTLTQRDEETSMLVKHKKKLIKIGAKMMSHGRYVAFQMAEVAAPANKKRITAPRSRNILGVS
jgi:hypothetical protein